MPGPRGTVNWEDSLQGVGAAALIGRRVDNNAEKLPRPRIAVIGDSLVGDQVVGSLASNSQRWRVGETITAGHFRWPEYGVDESRDLFQGTAGVTGSVPPIWPTTIGGRVRDGTVFWTRVANTSEIFRPGGWWAFAEAMLLQRVETVMVNGVGGASIEDCILRLPVVLATNPDFVLIQAGANNCSGTKGASDGAGIWTVYKQLVDAVLAGGKVAICTTAVCSAFYDTAAKRKAWRYLNDQIRSYARTTANVIVIEFSDVYVNETDGYSIATTTLGGTSVEYTDNSGAGVHPTGPANMLLAKRIWERLDPLVPQYDVFGSGPDSDYNMIVNPSMHGTGGTASTNMTGNVATGWVATAFGTVGAGSITGTASKVARTDNIRGFYQRLRYQLTAGATPDNLDFSLTPNVTPASPWNIGDTLEGFVEIGPQTYPQGGLQTIEVRARCIDAPGPFHYFNRRQSGDIPVASAADSGFTFPRMILRVSPFRVQPSTTGINFLIKGYGSGATCDFTLDVGRVLVRPVARNP